MSLAAAISYPNHNMDNFRCMTRKALMWYMRVTSSSERLLLDRQNSGHFFWVVRSFINMITLIEIWAVSILALTSPFKFNSGMGIFICIARMLPTVLWSKWTKILQLSHKFPVISIFWKIPSWIIAAIYSMCMSTIASMPMRTDPPFFATMTTRLNSGAHPIWSSCRPIPSASQSHQSVQSPAWASSWFWHPPKSLPFRVTPSKSSAQFRWPSL